MTCFTICSNNYLGRAQVLAASLRAGSDVNIYLFLADSMNDAIDYEGIGLDRVVFPEELGIEGLDKMKERYNVIEFNTALKPFAFTYLLRHTQEEEFYYFDPDIFVYEPLSSFSQHWKDMQIVLTPHINTPIPLDDKFPAENLFLNHGNYNLGFLGLRRSEVTTKMLEWWSLRMQSHCIIDLKEGYFVDQIWGNLMSLFYKDHVAVCQHPGWNMAYWNLHERILSFHDGSYYVNGDDHLYFYHFSSFDQDLNSLSPGGKRARFCFDDLPVLKQLYREYKERLDQFDQQQFRQFAYFNGTYPVLPKYPSFSRRVVRKLKSYLFQ